MKQLLNQNSEGWNEDLLKSLFYEEKVQAILAIPVRLMGAKDRLVWPYSSNGQYTVSSGYKVAKMKKQQQKEEEGPSSKRTKDEKMLWKKVWSLNIKNKIHNFIWKAFHDRLPVAMNLMGRGIQVDKVCR